MLDRETFTKCIEEIKTVNEFWDKLNSCLEDYGAEGYIFPPSCMDATFTLLEHVMNDSAGFISSFCWDLEFGKRYKPETVYDEYGNDVDLSSIDKLYDFLVGEES